MTKGDNNNNNNGSEQENATALLVDVNGVRPNDPRSSTGVAFFSTYSTGRLAFLHNMIAIYQVKTSPGGTAIRMWEWKRAELPFGRVNFLIKNSLESSEYILMQKHFFKLILTKWHFMLF